MQFNKVSDIDGSKMHTGSLKTSSVFPFIHLALHASQPYPLIPSILQPSAQRSFGLPHWDRKAKFTVRSTAWQPVCLCVYAWQAGTAYASSEAHSNFFYIALVTRSPFFQKSHTFHTKIFSDFTLHLIQRRVFTFLLKFKLC